MTDISCTLQIIGWRMCSIFILHQWSLAVFLLCSPVALDGKPVDALSSRTWVNFNACFVNNRKEKSCLVLKKIKHRLMKLHEATFYLRVPFVGFRKHRLFVESRLRKHFLCFNSGILGSETCLCCHLLFSNFQVHGFKFKMTLLNNNVWHIMKFEIKRLIKKEISFCVRFLV